MSAIKHAPISGQNHSIENLLTFINAFYEKNINDGLNSIDRMLLEYCKSLIIDELGTLRSTTPISLLKVGSYIALACNSSETPEIQRGIESINGRVMKMEAIPFQMVRSSLLDAMDVSLGFILRIDLREVAFNQMIVRLENVYELVQSLSLSQVVTFDGYPWLSIRYVSNPWKEIISNENMLLVSGLRVGTYLPHLRLTQVLGKIISLIKLNDQTATTLKHELSSENEGVRLILNFNKEE